MFKGTQSDGNGRNWGSVEDRELIRLRANGISYQTCAIALHRTVSAVRNRCFVIKARFANGSEQSTKLQHRITVLSNPHTIASAAREMGVAVVTVERIKHRLRLSGYPIAKASAIVGRPFRGNQFYDKHWRRRADPKRSGTHLGGNGEPSRVGGAARESRKQTGNRGATTARAG